MEFQSACDDLEEEIVPPGGKQPNERKIKRKMTLVRSSYDEAVNAQAQVVTLEKTSASDEGNRSWVKVNLRQPFRKVLRQQRICWELWVWRMTWRQRLRC